ncbi:MAG: cupredoxin family copper-binding protein [Candidatus Paceibacterota bacterium]|jgi:plastocyanin
MKITNAFIGLTAVVIVLGGAYYFSRQYYAAPVPQNYNNVPVDGTNSVPAGTNAVSMQNYSFAPATLTVKAGTAVVWTNNDSVPHTIKSAGFNSGTMSKGQTFEFKFENAGSYDYLCGLHPSMTGKIIVE